MVWRQLDEYLRPAWYIWSSYRLVSVFKIYSSTTSRSQVLIPQDQNIGGGVLQNITETAGPDPYRMKDDYIIWTRWVSVPRRRDALSLFKRQPMKVPECQAILGSGGSTLWPDSVNQIVAFEYGNSGYVWKVVEPSSGRTSERIQLNGTRRSITWPVPLWRCVAFRPHLRVPYIGELSAWGCPFRLLCSLPSFVFAERTRFVRTCMKLIGQCTVPISSTPETFGDYGGLCRRVNTQSGQ